jgi:hypothetical protein
VFTFDHAWGAILTLFTIVLGWLHLSHRREIDDLKTASEKAQKSADDVAGSLAKHQLYAAETYARKPDVEKAMEKSEERIMKRLDELSEEIKERWPPPRAN